MSEPVCLFRRDNGFYYIRVRMKDGRDRWKSTGERTKTAALAAIKKGLKFKEKRELEPAPEPVKHDFGQLTARVLEYVQANYAQNTYDIYRLTLDAIRRIIGDVPLDSVTAADADRFKITRLAEMAPASVNLQLQTLRAAFGNAKRWRMIEHNPFTGVALVRVPDKAPSFLTVEQFGELIKRITDHWLRNLVMFAACTGMRQGEIRHLEWQHVDMDRRIVHVTSTATFTRPRWGRGGWCRSTRRKWTSSGGSRGPVNSCSPCTGARFVAIRSRMRSRNK